MFRKFKNDLLDACREMIESENHIINGLFLILVITVINLVIASLSCLLAYSEDVYFPFFEGGIMFALFFTGYVYIAGIIRIFFSSIDSSSALKMSLIIFYLPVLSYFILRDYINVNDWFYYLIGIASIIIALIIYKYKWKE